jgi:thiol:disulfide interchange protein
MRYFNVRACAYLLFSLLVGCEIGVEQPGPTTTRPTAASTAAGQSNQPAANQILTGQLHFVASYEQGYRQAAGEGKPILLFFTARWCKFCHQMAEEAFTNPQVVRLANHFVCVLVDADAAPDVCQQFQVTGYPTIQFLSPRGAVLGRVVGKKPGHQLMMAMQAALQNVARRADEATETQAR